MTPNAPQPPVPEPDAACDPHRGEPTQDWGLQHTFHCVRLSSRYRERCLKKPWEKRAGWILIQPAPVTDKHIRAQETPAGIT